MYGRVGTFDPNVHEWAGSFTKELPNVYFQLEMCFRSCYHGRRGSFATLFFAQRVASHNELPTVCLSAPLVSFVARRAVDRAGVAIFVLCLRGSWVSYTILFSISLLTLL